ncbi:MAG TPA: hypothetical protein DCS43_16590 [Verrucomicrobia bacterium]|nr:hypothetical protein [Verrucomicrobiota bacterium]
MKARQIICRLGLLLLVIAPDAVMSEQRQFVPLPIEEPVLAGNAPDADAIATLVVGLGHAEYRERLRNKEALTTLLIRYGKNAYDILNRDQYRKHEDPEIAFSVTEVLSSTRSNVVPSIDMTEIEALVAKGLTKETLYQLNAGGVSVADLMIQAHLQMKMGVDVLYSLNPENVLPGVCRLLPLQKEDYYRVLLAKTMEGVLARAVKPVHEDQALHTGGIDYFRDRQDTAKDLIALTTSACDELRLTALRICAYGLIPLSQDRMQALLEDENQDIAAEAARLHGLFIKEMPVDDIGTTYARWVNGCADALSQQDDLLAQLGAYNALTDLIDGNADALYAAYLTTADGVAKDALGYILSGSLIGRLLLLRDGKQASIRLQPPSSLSRILLLWSYDVKLEGLAELIKTDGEAVAPLVRRNLFILGRSEQKWFSRITWSKDAWSAAVQLSMHDLSPILEQQLSVHGANAEMEQLLRALSETKGEAFPSNPAAVWYALCAEHLDAPPLDIRTGAVRSLLASGKAGAQALLAHHRKSDWEDPDFGMYIKSLVMFHPYSKFLVDDTDEGQQLKADLEQSALAFSDHVKSDPERGASRQIYDGGTLRIPVALWAFANNNDANCLNPIGNYLAVSLKEIHAPLILSWLDYNSRMSILLIEVDARNAREAVLRRIGQRRRDWAYCYDHDLFHFVVVYELLEALPFLEHYVKTNGTWPYRGIKTMAGIERERYCWTAPVKSGRVNPLVLPSCRELMRYYGNNTHGESYGKQILAELNLTGDTVNNHDEK